MSLGHSALAPSGHPIWLDMARRSARAADGARGPRLTMRDVLSDASRRERAGGARRVRRIDEPDPPPSGDRARRRTAPADRRRLGARQPADPSTRGCAAERSAPLCDGPGLSRRRRTGSHAASASDGRARHSRADGRGHHARRAARRVGIVRAARHAATVAARARRHRSRRCDHGAGGGARRAV